MFSVLSKVSSFSDYNVWVMVNDLMNWRFNANEKTKLESERVATDSLYHTQWVKALVGASGSSLSIGRLMVKHLSP